MYIALISVLMFRLLDISLAASTLEPREVVASGKPGLPWSNGDTINFGLDQFNITDKLPWYYTYDANPLNSTLEFVPMLWGGNDTDNFSSTINGTLNSTSLKVKVKAVLGMNEPLQADQSNLTPAAGAAMWMTYIEPLHAQGIQLGSPSFSNLSAGTAWLSDFFTSCTQLADDGCTVDFLALHWYGSDADAFQTYLDNFHNIFQRPVWVTEWTCINDSGACNMNDTMTFMEQTQNFMDTTDWVQRYAWFGAIRDAGNNQTNNALLTKNGGLNNLGYMYIGAQSTSAQSTGADSNGVGRGLALYPVLFLVLFVPFVISA